ncbi:TraX family protein [Marinobacterium sp. BA1]|uniref:TraX family protein n=1 Tax=Marinobacterium sp. BA1 TaxID=3138931 RepID=UPI0032E5A530
MLNALQWLAMSSMLVDHIVQSPLWLNMEGHSWLLSSTIGRIAYPLYAGLVVWTSKTRPSTRHLMRLWSLALIAQIPYLAAMHPDTLSLPLYEWKWNVCVSLALGASLIQGYQQKQLIVLGMSLCLITLMTGFNIRYDYGLAGILWMCSLAAVLSITHRLVNYGMRALLTLMTLIIGVMGSYHSMMLSVTVVCATTLMMLLNFEGYVIREIQCPRAPSWLWRGFYPGHLICIAGIGLLTATP